MNSENQANDPHVGIRRFRQPAQMVGTILMGAPVGHRGMTPARQWFDRDPPIGRCQTDRLIVYALRVVRRDSLRGVCRRAALPAFHPA